MAASLSSYFQAYLYGSLKNPLFSKNTNYGIHQQPQRPYQVDFKCRGDTKEVGEREQMGGYDNPYYPIGVLVSETSMRDGHSSWHY